MALVMPSPRKHPVTGIFEHFRRVPADLAERVKGKEVAVPVAGERRTIRLGTHAKVTLSTRDPAEAKRRFAAVVEALDAFYASTRSGPVRMNHRQRQAVAGEVYKGLVAASADDPGSADHWREKAALLRQHVTEANSDPETRALALEMLVAPTVDDALAARGLSVTEESRRELLDDAAHFLALAFRDAEAMARRDYTMRSVPTWTDSDPAASAPPKPDRDGLTFSAIIDEEERLRTLGKDAKGIPAATLAKFRRECASLAAHRGTDDATTLTTAAVRSWIEALQEEGRLSNRTIGNSLTDIGAVRRWGVRQNEAAFAGAPDPFKGVRKPGFEDAEAGARTYTMAEARTILKAARKEHRAERHWLPWLCAFSGARVQEVAGLRKEDFDQVDGIVYFRLTKAGGRSLKNKFSERRVPVHPSLKAEGLLDFVAAAPAGRLFIARAAENVGKWVTADLKIARPKLAPNHGWRHLFHDLCAAGGVSDSALNYLTGRTTGHSSESYGRSEAAVPGLFREISKVTLPLETKRQAENAEKSTPEAILSNPVH